MGAYIGRGANSFIPGLSGVAHLTLLTAVLDPETSMMDEPAKALDWPAALALVLHVLDLIQ